MKTGWRRFRVIKWLMVAVDVCLFFVLLNALFLVPGPYLGERGVIIVMAATLSGIVSWICARMFGADGSQVTDGARAND